MIDVSIVIVCMNNLKNLYPCLESIKQHTEKVSYETIVVAYLFTKENLERAKADFPWVKFVESNEIRGFSENNNLALRQTKGNYCFVLNDDTYHNEHVVDNLVETIKTLSQNIAVLSPVIIGTTGVVQRCGKPKYNIATYLLELCGLIRLYDKYSKYTNQKGIFKSYNLSGAAFLIRREVFEEVGWFDEKYFFCPEDIALSRLLNKKGYNCYVDANVRLTHAVGGTWSKTIQATKPATAKGLLLFYRDESLAAAMIYRFLATFEYTLKSLYWIMKGFIKTSEHCKVMYKANIHAVYALHSHKTPKQLFTKYYLNMR